MPTIKRQPSTTSRDPSTPLTYRPIALPATIAVIVAILLLWFALYFSSCRLTNPAPWSALVNCADTTYIDDTAVAPVLVVLLALLVTFGWRAWWLNRHRTQGREWVKDYRAFAPERTVVLGSVIILAIFILALILHLAADGDFDLINTNGPLSWAVGISTTVCLIDAWVTSWGSLRVYSPEDRVEYHWPPGIPAGGVR